MWPILPDSRSEGGKMSIEVYDRRGRGGASVRKGDVVRLEEGSGGTHIIIVLDNGYAIGLPKALVPELVEAAEQQ